MIELNLTYEESKKILELGYDFAPVCTKFELYEADGLEAEKRYTKKIVYGEKVSEETVRSKYTLIGDESWFQGKAWVQDFIPIIPKAALEACLPDNSLFPISSEEHSLDWVIYQKYRFIGLRFWSTKSAKSEGGHITWHQPEERHRFQSIYEAFIWCHENYPEELKKKFEEVMK